MKNLIIIILIILILYLLYLNSEEHFKSRRSRTMAIRKRRERRSRRRSRARNKRKRIAARRRRRTKKLFGGIKYMFNKVTKGVGNIAKGITDKIKMTQPKLKCWKMMPTGCDSKLTEPGSGGHGREWFKDKYSKAKNNIECSQSIQRFNDYCNRTDAKSYWGKKPNTLNQKFLDGLEQKDVEDKKKDLTNKIDEYLSNLNNMKTEMALEDEDEDNVEDETKNEFEDDLEDEEPPVNLFSNENLFNNRHPENIKMEPKPFKYEYVGFNKNLTNCSKLNGWAKYNCRMKNRKNKKIEGRM